VNERPQHPEEREPDPTRLHRMSTSRTRPARRRRSLPVPPGPGEARLRRRLGRWTLVLGTLAAVSVLAAALLARRAQAPSTMPVGATPVEALRATDVDALTPVTVTRVIDGATLDVSALGTALQVRLLGVAEPAPGAPCAAEATRRLTALASSEVRLRPDSPQQDDAGHELRYVYTADGHSIDATLVAEGLAAASRDRGALRDDLAALEDDAHAARRGCLWGGA
jgi:endonuclease YncB( thermonuclease family)